MSAARACLVATLLALYLKTFLLAAAIIPSASMEPTLVPGDRVLVNRMIFVAPPPPGAQFLPLREVRRGDVLWLRSPEDPTSALVKRCTAVAGDRFAARTLAPRTLAVEGDNRANSLDSRSFGPVARAAVGGRVFLVLWSARPRGGVRWPRLLRLVR